MPELVDLVVDWISLVARPATGKPLVLKANQRARPVRLVRMVDEEMRAYGIVYAPDQPDSHGDYASAATIRQAANRFLRDGLTKRVDTEHNFSESGHYIAESWLVRTGDPLFPEEPAGAWAVGVQVTDPIEWAGLKNGDRSGLSLAGFASVRDDQAPSNLSRAADEQTPGWFSRFINGFRPKGSDEVTKEELTEVVKTALSEALKGSGPNGSGESGTDSASGKPGGGDAAPAVIAKALADALAPVTTALAAMQDSQQAALASLGELQKATPGKGRAEGGPGEGMSEDDAALLREVDL